MPTFKEIKKGLLGHVIAALLFLIFIEPILKGLYSLLISMGDYLSKTFVNHIYAHAALHETTEGLIFVISLILLQGILFYMFYAGFRCIALLKEFRSHEKEKEYSTEEKKVLLGKRISRTYLVVTKIVRHLKLVQWIICPFSVILFFPIFFFLFTQFTSIELNLSFDQRLTAVSPYLKENGEKFIKSKWATMQNESDFQAINKELDSIAQKNNVELPPNLLK